jgi:nucleoside-specific outer membrane channel protein Tsx
VSRSIAVEFDHFVPGLPVGVIISALLVTATWVHAADWSTTNVQVLHGSGYEFGPSEKQTLTFNHASGWKFGAHSFFFDVADFAGPATDIYGEWYPSLSLDKLSHGRLARGVLADVSLEGQIDYAYGIRAYLYGIGVSMKIPGVAFDKLVAYVHHEDARGGDVYELTWVWSIPVQRGRLRVTFAGWGEAVGAGGGKASHLLVQPRLLADVGAVFGAPGIVEVGMEYEYWRNKFGVEGVTERVPQGMLQWTF